MTDINFFGGIPLGKIKGWEYKKAATLMPVPLPGEDAGKVEAVDALGIIAYMNFSGAWTGKFSAIQGYAGALEGIADGQQTSVAELKSPFVNGKDGNGILRLGNIGVNTSTDTNKLIDSEGNFALKGIQAGDYVKNLVTGDVATITGTPSATELSLTSYGGGASDIFPVSGTSYAVTATLTGKIISVSHRWELPALAICNYTLSIVQSK